MKLVTFSAGSHEKRVGIMTDSGIIDVRGENSDAPATMIELAGLWDKWRGEFERIARRQPDVQTAKLHAPVPRPGKVLAIGLNYADHIEESGAKTPEHQVWFCKHVTSVAGPSEDIQMPKVSSALDYEAEMVVVIGKGGRHISKANA